MQFFAILLFLERSEDIYKCGEGGEGERGEKYKREKNGGAKEGVGEREEAREEAEREKIRKWPKQLTKPTSPATTMKSRASSLVKQSVITKNIQPVLEYPNTTRRGGTAQV